MSLLDRLRPKWQSADAEVRAQAVRELPKDEVELLTAVAQQDADPRVRRIALKKLESPRLLLSIADTDGDQALRSFARKRARQLLVHIACDERDIEESKRALALLTRPTGLSSRSGPISKSFAPRRSMRLPTTRRSPKSCARRRTPGCAFGLTKITSPQALKKVVIDEASGTTPSRRWRSRT
jgi:hypothetical protein